MVSKLLFLALLIGLLHYGSSEEKLLSRETKIVGGTQVTDRSRFAYQVSLRYQEDHRCGGTILDEEHIITAAHCCFSNKLTIIPANELSVYAGDLQLSRNSSTTQRYLAKYIFTHSEYDLQSLSNDIAIIRLETKLKFDATVKSLQLARSLPGTNTICIVSGWGATQEQSAAPNDNLNFIEVPIINHSYCKLIYQSSLKKGMFCAGNLLGGQYRCQGDTGGPLACNLTTLTGIVSWGHGCAQPGKPGVYTDISNYVDWIEKEKLRSNSNKRYGSVFNTVLMIILNYCILSM